MVTSPYMSARRFVLRYVRWAIISYYENKANYTKTKIGLLWVPLANMLFVVLLVALFAGRGTQNVLDYFLYVASGFILWVFIQDTIAQGSTIFISKRDFAISNSLTVDDQMTKETMERMFRHVLNVLLFFFILMFITPTDLPRFIVLYGVFSIFLFWTSYQLSYVLSTLVVMYPDIGNGTQLLTRFLFFASPVFWRSDINVSLTGVETLGFREMLELVNPVSYYLSIARQIIGVEAFSMERVVGALLISLFIAMTAFVLERKLGAQVKNTF